MTVKAPQSVSTHARCIMYYILQDSKLKEALSLHSLGGTQKTIYLPLLFLYFITISATEDPIDCQGIEMQPITSLRKMFLWIFKLQLKI